MNDKTRQPDKQSASDPGTRLGRRDVLKALASIPAMALFVYELLKKRAFDGLRKLNILSELGAPMEAPASHTLTGQREKRRTPRRTGSTRLLKHS